MPKHHFDEEEPVPELATGHVEVGNTDSPSDTPKAVLWIPDPEQRWGWREFYVRATPPQPKPGRWGY